MPCRPYFTDPYVNPYRTKPMTHQQRLKTLDGFRALAIMAVILYHFFSRWIFGENSSLYPYGNRYDHFKYGYVGVQFFFIISGFVIFYTLEGTDGLKTFWIRRMIRLVPTMIIASLVTLVVLRLFDSTPLFPASHSIANLLPCITFLPPAVFAALLPGWNFDYVNGSYWSLWPEIQFYFLASTLYYFDKRHFLRNFSIVSLILIFLYWFVSHVRVSGSILHIHVSPATADLAYRWLTVYVNLPEYLVYFSVGVFFYVAYKYHSLDQKLPRPVIAGLVVFILIFLYFGVTWQKYIIYGVLLLLFFSVIYFSRFVAWLGSPFFAEIGVASYAVYLFHENIGVMLIHDWAGNSAFAFLVPLLFIVFICVLCIIYTHTLEKRISEGLKRFLLGKGRRAPLQPVPGDVKTS